MDIDFVVLWVDGSDPVWQNINAKRWTIAMRRTVFVTGG